MRPGMGHPGQGWSLRDRSSPEGVECTGLGWGAQEGVGVRQGADGGWDKDGGKRQTPPLPRAVGGRLAATTYTLQVGRELSRERNKSKNMSDGGNSLSKC